MIVRALKDIINTKRDVAWGGGNSRRFSLEEDGLGFTIADTIVDAGGEWTMEYKNQLEACYVLEGRGTLTDEATGEVHTLEPEVMYMLNQHDKHTVRAETTLRMVAVFSPALKGDEKHRGGEGY